MTMSLVKVSRNFISRREKGIDIVSMFSWSAQCEVMNFNCAIQGIMINIRYRIEW